MSNEDASTRDGGANDRDVVVESTFDVASTPGHAWAALVQLTAAHGPEPGTWWLPGFECRATEVVALPAQRLEVIKADPPCEGTTIVLTFEHRGTGSRIHVTQSGFDPTFVERAGDDFWAHGRLLLAEVERFFLAA